MQGIIGIADMRICVIRTGTRTSTCNEIVQVRICVLVKSESLRTKARASPAIDAVDTHSTGAKKFSMINLRFFGKDMTPLY